MPLSVSVWKKKGPPGPVSVNVMDPVGLDAPERVPASLSAGAKSERVRVVGCKSFGAPGDGRGREQRRARASREQHLIHRKAPPLVVSW